MKKKIGRPKWRGAAQCRPQGESAEDESAENLENLARRFTALPALVAKDEDLRRRGVELCTTCLIGIRKMFFMSVERGIRLDLSHGPQLMCSLRFAVRGSTLSWAQFWQAVPPPGWHDLFAHESVEPR